MEFDLIRRLGVPVHEIPDLPVLVSYDETLRLALLRQGLDHVTREWCAGWLLSEVCREPQATANEF